MRFIQRITWNLPDLEYFVDGLGWPVASMEEVVNLLKDWNDQELHDLLGDILDYDCYAADEEDNEE